jgi:hypothetical protein
MLDSLSNDEEWSEPKECFTSLVLYSLTDEAYGEFIKAVDVLLETKDKEEDIMKLLNHWKVGKLDAQKVAGLWAKEIYNEGRNAPFEACANLEHANDRIAYARYLFTGYIFLDENDIKFGNMTMFLIPEEFGYTKCEDEIFVHTFNFLHPHFVYEKSLANSVDKFMMSKTKEIIELIQGKQVKMNFKIATIGPDESELLNAIKSMNAYTIDWSNIIDYFSKNDFLKMSKAVSSDDTVHYVHMMNWVRCYKGASYFDYEYQDKIMLVENALAGCRNFHQSFHQSHESYGNM